MTQENPLLRGTRVLKECTEKELRSFLKGCGAKVLEFTDTETNLAATVEYKKGIDTLKKAMRKEYEARLHTAETCGEDRAFVTLWKL